ncbi:MAG: RNA-binding protein [Candidatus Thorarchaeota archaeon]|nr:MAG: RNA-binding protein [Candidatus Thorarchaeota archaeon]
MMADVKSGDVVVPGDQLCVIEELIPSFGTYEKDGIVYAASPGSVSMDLKERSISVLASRGRPKISLPMRGDIVLGEVINAFEQRAEVSIVRINEQDYLSGLAGEIHISNVTRRYVKSMLDVLQVGDIIRAKALTTHEIPVQLSLVGPEFGVIYAKCVKCGNPLTLTTHNNMFCLRCEHRSTREVATDYGLSFGLETQPALAPKRRPYDRSRFGRGDRDGRGGNRRYDRGGGRSSDRRYDRRRTRPRYDRRRRD